MNLSPAWVDVLNAAGFEAVHWSQIGSAKAPDSEVMHWAAAHGYRC
jgi:predicted nuclease of predicted toxin-antitoxin system